MIFTPFLNVIQHQPSLSFPYYDQYQHLYHYYDNYHNYNNSYATRNADQCNQYGEQIYCEGNNAYH